MSDPEKSDFEAAWAKRPWIAEEETDKDRAWRWWKAGAASVPNEPQEVPLTDVLASCKIEHKEFEKWAAAEKYDMHEHPLHYLFMDTKTNAARQGWKAALRYVASQVSRPTLGRDGGDK